MKAKALTLSTLVVILCGACHGSSTSTAENTDDDTFTEIASFNSDSAYHYITNQVTFGPRVPNTQAHVQCGDYILNSLERFGADTIIVQNADLKIYTGEVYKARNIIARYNTKSKKRIMLLAHWDTRPWADQEDNKEERTKPVPGANDGGSGVGVLLEIARQLGNTAPNIGVDLLFCDAEDSGNTEGWGNSDETWCLGTQYWIKNKHYKNKSEWPEYAILLDMVGGKNAQFHRELLSNQVAPTIVNKVWDMAHKSGYGSVFINTLGSQIIDDHEFINEAGIPCIDIIENWHPDTGSFNPTWHTLKDDLSAIDCNTLKAVGQTVLNVVYNEQAE
jgi:hypothetical protein